MQHFVFSPPEIPQDAEDLRMQVRAFLSRELAGSRPVDLARSWSGFDADFSRKMAAEGWIGMTWPKRYGGAERSSLHRYVVLEELLAAGAPVAAHWIADRQSGPLLLRFGSEEQRQEILPRIVAGECFFCIGMSEPDSGSDLAATRTRARPVDGGYVVNGAKLWTTYAHKSDYMILFCRTGDDEGGRHGGMSQFLVDLTTPGIEIRPILDLSGAHHFNEVSFTDVFLPTSALIGKEGDGWDQVMSELAFERSGPDRFLSTFTLIRELVRALEGWATPAACEAVGRLVAHLVVLRRLSRSVAGMLQKGENPTLHAAIIKDLGTLLEQEVPDIARSLIAAEPSLEATNDFEAVLAHAILNVPAFSLRGGTREIMRGIIARGLGLR
ncbi:acyl-CoA dehydrogenase family protein [uncultured Roseibium sp.]|uniref:acyl-CoA dehydrogenase family protein n=1 Tax=uncultured Roseibium sp. TaxID=1936171 RepID=UPI003217F33C